MYYLKNPSISYSQYCSGHRSQDPAAVGAALIAPMELFTSHDCRYIHDDRLIHSRQSTFFFHHRPSQIRGPKIDLTNSVPFSQFSTAFLRMIRIHFEKDFSENNTDAFILYCQFPKLIPCPHCKPTSHHRWWMGRWFSCMPESAIQDWICLI
jgi:hypothetical protein